MTTRAAATVASAAHARGGVVGVGLRTLGSYWWQAVSGGRFFTRWTLFGSGVTAVFVLSPIAGLTSFPEYLGAMTASLITWVVLVAALLPAAAAERRLRSRYGRGALVIVSLLIASFARPFLNDLVAEFVFGHAVTAGWGQRVLTNTLTWFALLPLIAGAVTWYADARRSAARLSAALAVFDDLRHRINNYGHQNTVILTDAIARLRERRDALLADTVDFDAVRSFAEEVRATSHRLDERLQTALDYRSGYAIDGRVPLPAVPWLARLVPPPPLLVVLLYFIASLPYTFTAGGHLLVLISFLLLVVLSTLAHVAVKLVARAGAPVARGAAIIAAWTIVGLIMTAAGMIAQAGDGAVLAVPILVIPSLAVVIGFCADALRRTREDSGALTELLSRTSSLVTARTALAREPLWRGVDLLHDRVQSRCVIFAARADERQPTPEEIERFRIETDNAFDAILAGTAHHSAEPHDLDGLLATWAGVLDVDAALDAPAVIALQSPEVSAGVVAAVSEGLINAVKHSAARSASLTITTAPDGSALTVVIASAGALGTGAGSVPTARRGLGLASLGGRARLTQVGDDVVLEVTVPLRGEAHEGSAPSRRWNLPTSAVRLRGGQALGSLHDSDSI